jgi:[ribosomal protein S18]-alanine N-acetyltransferase
MTVIIRIASIKDVHAMNELNRQCLLENYSLYDWYMTLSLTENVSRIAVDGERIVGYCLAIYYPRQRQGTIASIAVHPDYRRKGLANQLMSETMESLKSQGANCVNLMVRKSNLVAQHLYKQLGFCKYKSISKYYQNGEDAYGMRKLYVQTQN